jgi:hypothetical protein
LIPGCCPPGTFGAGVAVTGGVNRLPPVGLMLFSVGDAGALLAGAELLGGVVAVVLDGLSLPPPPHAAVSVLIAMIAAPPAKTPRCRPKRREFMDAVLNCDIGASRLVNGSGP